jgi:hypothetical protein
MARFALIDGDGAVDNVIVADTVEIAQTIAALRGHTAREVVTEFEEPLTLDAIRSRTCEPGATLVERTAREGEESRARDRGGELVVDDFEREGGR